MNAADLANVLAKHAAWLHGQPGSARADLSGAYLRSADLRSAYLSGANLRSAYLSGAYLRSADLSGANLRSADLSGAYLSGANLRSANLRGADLSGADLRSAYLSGANLRSAYLSGANLSGANLSGANLSGAYLSGANLSGANLSGANLSGAKGLLPAADWLARFDRDADGVIVFKAIGGTIYPTPASWEIKPGAVLIENVAPTRTQLCGCGVNFGTLDFVQRLYPNSVVWRCRIAWIDLADVVVPYGTDGKARCARLTLLETVAP